MMPEEAQPTTQDTQPTPDQALDPTQPAADGMAEAQVPADAPALDTTPEVTFSWQASEFVHHQKSIGWYGILALIVIVLAAVAVWLKLWLEIGLFFAAGIAVVVSARRPPAVLMYELSADGIRISGKMYPFENFRSFGVMPDEDWHYIDLEPVKRFNPRMVILFNTDDFDEIVGHLERHLPREDRQPDTIERITRYIGF